MTTPKVDDRLDKSVECKLKRFLAIVVMFRLDPDDFREVLTWFRLR